MMLRLRIMYMTVNLYLVCVCRAWLAIFEWARQVIAYPRHGLSIKDAR